MNIPSVQEIKPALDKIDLKEIEPDKDPSLDSDAEKQEKRDICQYAIDMLNQYIDIATQIIDFATGNNSKKMNLVGLGTIGKVHCCIHSDGNDGWTLHASMQGDVNYYQDDILYHKNYGPSIYVKSGNMVISDDIATAKQRIQFIQENIDNHKKSWYVRMLTLSKKLKKRSNWIIKEFKQQISNRLSEQKGNIVDDEEDEDE